MKTPKDIKIFIAAAVLFAVYAFYCFWMIADEKTVLWGIVYGLGIAVVLACLWGVWNLKNWALYLSYALLLGAFCFGAYYVHFAWTFWLFERPTLVQKILNVLNPRISVFVLFPVIWIAYFVRKGNKLT